MKGQGVCGHHGGRSPQAKRSAKERLAELVEPALEGLYTALKSGEIPSIVKAAQVVLDRTGFHPSQTVKMEIDNPREQLAKLLDVNIDELPD